MYFFNFENDYEKELFLNDEKEEQNNEPFLNKKKKLILIILFLILIFSLGYYIYFLPNINENDLLNQLKASTDIETYNKIIKHIKNIYENPYYSIKELNQLRFIQWTNLITKAENYEELVKCIEQLIEKAEKDLFNEKKYTSYK